MKYAVVEHAGKQFVAAEGQLVEVDRLALQSGTAVEFDEVLLLRDTDHVEVGAPYIQGARVTGRIQAHLRGPKILVFKYRAKQRYRVRQGHRQALTRVAIESIGLPGAATAEPKPQHAEPRRTARKPASSAAKRPAAPPKAKAPAQSAGARPKSRAGKADKGKQPKSAQAAKKPAAQKKSAGSKKK